MSALCCGFNDKQSCVLQGCLHVESSVAGLQRGGNDRHAKNAKPSAAAQTAMPESDRPMPQVAHPQAFICMQ